MPDPFPTPTVPVPSRVKGFFLNISTTEDDYEDVPAKAEVLEDLDAVPPIVGVPAQAAIPAHTDTTYNYNFKFDVLDADGVTMEHCVGDVSAQLTTAQLTQLKNILDSLHTMAKNTLP